ncbi:NAD(P)H-dependent oxidoreductase [Leptospira levettii]|uniref:Flavodoxin family protein n=1 Tax=Leptospira levettii TaxID=2023178 RepID=A0ABY2MLY8_9LEPT|nr:NAD(P)H-dependent oxidoreductase [Leptospira levettii]PKA28344.1 NADPH:quinone reductase [Leptospira sp. mixed culture ATI2-C-A1]TGL68959.1 flavodoxin family protein [Leptospira levettii]TGM27448.1 flavodoxin family protein [Leptospira levettii]
MQNKKILIILGHPNPNSYCAKLADSYFRSAKSSGFEIQFLKLNELNFDYNLKFGYDKTFKQELEPDILMSQSLIQNADHFVFVYPSWWASMPAILKAWIDRVFLPGFAFSYQKRSPLPKQLLKGKTARIIITMDAPTWYYKWFNRSPGVQLLKQGTLEFCGFKQVKVTYFDQIRFRNLEKLNQFIIKTEKLGAMGA